MKTALALLAVLLLAGAGQASLTDRTLAPACAALGLPPGECSTQYDGGAHGDAPDVCGPPGPVLHIPGSTRGLLLPVDDPADFYDLPVSAALVGKRVTVTVGAANPLGTVFVGPGQVSLLDVTVLNPACTAPAGPDEAADVALGADAYAFTPRAAGTYHVRVALRLVVGLSGFPGGAPGGPGGGGGGEPGVPGDPGGPGADYCHAFCYGSVVHPLAGYSLASFAS